MERLQNTPQLWSTWIYNGVWNNRPFSKMAATNPKLLKLNWVENQYQHLKDHLLFGNRTKFH